MAHPNPSDRERSGPRPPARRRPLAGALVGVLLLAGCAPGGDATATAPTAPAAMGATDAPAAPGAVGPVPERGTAGAYLSLADYEQDPSSFAGDDVVLFFAASWCSTCRRTRANIEADLAGIPPGLVIVVVDYDAARDLRRRYGVTVQHTFVQIDGDGELLKKWSGSLTAQQIAEQTV
jgi:thioredoxin 1